VHLLGGVPADIRPKHDAAIANKVWMINRPPDPRWVIHERETVTRMNL
jgi:hypothetical protein